MHDHLGEGLEEEELDQADGEAEASPVVAVLEHLQAVAVEVDVAVEVHLLERLHRDLVLAMVLGLVGGLLEGEVVLHRAAGQSGFLVLPGRERRDDEPEAAEDGKGGEDGKKDGSLQPAADLPREPERDEELETYEEPEREGVGTGAVGRQGGILDGGILIRNCQ